MDPAMPGGEQGKMRGEQGSIESTSLMLSSADDVSDRRDKSGGARLPDMVRTRGEPQGSSQPLSTVWADFWNNTGRNLLGDVAAVVVRRFVCNFMEMFKLRAVCWCSPAASSLEVRGQKASGPCSCRSCCRSGSGRTAPCLAHLESRWDPDASFPSVSKTKLHTEAD